MTMKSVTSFGKQAAIVFCLAGSLIAASEAQTSGSNPVSRPSQANSRSPTGADTDSFPSPFPDTNLQKRNSERQRRIVSDTQRLLYLANQLKTEASNSESGDMTPEMLHQMDEIEKLARSVKDRMRN